MELSGIRLGRRDRAELDRLLADAQHAELSYGHPGSTLRAGSPDEVPDRSRSVEVSGDLAAATRTLRAWAPHRGINGRIHPASAPLAEGTTLLVVAPFGPFEMAVPDRVVAVVDEPNRFGFAYGTLAGHPETGEEFFVADQISPGRLRLTVRVQAGPATLLARLATPLVTILQTAAVRRYVAAWSAAITQEGT
jgi:uncharacterized protein (UPF0548 family)